MSIEQLVPDPFQLEVDVIAEAVLAKKFLEALFLQDVSFFFCFSSFYSFSFSYPS